MRVYIVIAAYNEEKVIAQTLADLHKHGYKHIVVVNDGSADGTAKAVGSKATCLTHVINRGQGAALRTGISYALAQGADIIVTFDADGQHQAKNIAAMITPIKEGKALATLGSRFLDKSTNIPPLRKVLLKGSIFVQWLFYGITLSDAHCGLRALHKDAASNIDIRSDGMAHSHEFSEQIQKKNIPYQEIPIEVKYTEYSMQKGHGGFMQAIKVLFSMIKDKVIK